MGKMSSHPGRMLRSLSQNKIAKALAGVELEQTEVVHMDEGATARAEGRFVFECSWEVANKVKELLKFFINIKFQCFMRTL